MFVEQGTECTITGRMGRRGYQSCRIAGITGDRTGIITIQWTGRTDHFTSTFNSEEKGYFGSRIISAR